MTRSDRRDREFEALQDRLSRLSEASLRINESLDFDVVLQGTLDSARSLTGARYGVMTLLDDEGRVQDFLSSGLTAAESERLWLMPEGQRIFESLTNTSEPMRVPDLAEYARALGFAEFNIPVPVGVFRFMSAPMFHRGGRVGHLFVGAKDGEEEFTRADEETLVMFASQAALVISNARRHREERKARADLETLISISPVGVVVLDAQTGELASMNREAMRIVEGLREEDQPIEELLDVVTCVRSDGREVSLKELPLAEVLRDGETVRTEEIVLRVPDGRSVGALLNATPVHSEEGALASFVVTLQDIAPLREQERLRAEFLAMVSHELRTPLAAVKGSITTLLETVGVLDPAEMIQFFRIIQDQSDQMRYLIGDLLDVARIETGALSVAPEPADVRLMVDEARRRFAAEGIRNPVNMELRPDLPPVMADRRRIVQVLSNLFSNAGGHSPGESPILVTVTREGVHVAISVADQGSGIPEELLPEMFRTFSRASIADTGAGVDGSGLGLAICKGIVEAHGGRIWAESDGPGMGARFTFTLPTVEESASSALASPRSQRASRGRRIRVLAVDDDVQALRYIGDALTKAGYTPIVTSDPADVPRLMAEEKPHVVLLDLVLPGIDGIVLMNDILASADVPVIFLSVYGQEDTVARAFDMGATDYMVKPFSPTELAARIRAALRKRLDPFRDEPLGPYTADGLDINYAQRRVMMAGEPVQLTATEYAVLYELAVHAPRVLTHTVLLQRIWGPERVGESWLVRDVVKRLRRKLGDGADNPKYIVTEPRVGYRMTKGETAVKSDE
ncbi:MAG: ATP-binding protein [Chloroflexi bacterium]|nr:ATP-binding protein [Chloroflexota bacterium]